MTLELTNQEEFLKHKNSLKDLVADYEATIILQICTPKHHLKLYPQEQIKNKEDFLNITKAYVKNHYVSLDEYIKRTGEKLEIMFAYENEEQEFVEKAIQEYHNRHGFRKHLDYFATKTFPFADKITSPLFTKKLEDLFIETIIETTKVIDKRNKRSYIDEEYKLLALPSNMPAHSTYATSNINETIYRQEIINNSIEVSKRIFNERDSTVLNHSNIQYP